MWKKIILKPVTSKVMFLWLYIPAIFLLVIAAIASYYLKINISCFTRDPMAVAKGRPFFGLISNIGVILWSFSVAVCFFSYSILKTSKKHLDVLRFIVLGGFISFLLLIDDLFMLHERVYSKLIYGGEYIAILLYGVITLFYIVKFRKKIIETDFVFILLAVFFFGFSILVDLLPESLLPWHHLFEDGSKFLGIVSWLGFQILVCFQELKSVTYTPASNKSSNSDS